MFVIARNSTFIYKGKSVKVQEVGRDLGVRYILEGSVQKASERVRITAQLVDATTGHHLWAERYDRSIEDFFALQDEITHEIVVALQVELTDGERARTYRRTNSLEAWGYLVQALGHFNRFTRENNAKARALAEEAIKMDPNYAYAWAFLGWTHIMDAGFGAQSATSQHFKQAVTLAEKTLAMDDSIAEAHSLLSYIRLFQRDYDTALLEGAKAVALAPNDSYSHGIFANTMLFSGDFDGAIKMIRKAMRLSPYYPDWYLMVLANTHYMNEQYGEAVETWQRQHALIRQRGLGERRLIVGYVGLIACYVRLGQLDQAEKHLNEVLRLNPNFTFENMHKLNPYRNPSHLENILDALRNAGLK
jgi:adenylate cyclase